MPFFKTDISCHLLETSEPVIAPTTIHPRCQLEDLRFGMVEVGDVMKAVCKYCPEKLTTSKKSGTNSNRYHIAEYFSKISTKDRKMFLATVKITKQMN